MGIIELGTVSVVAIAAFVKSGKSVNKAVTLLIWGVTAVLSAGVSL